MPEAANASADAGGDRQWQAAGPIEAPSRRPWTTLLLLLGVFSINYMDRQILAILAQPIKTDLALSDMQVGLLYGAAFAVLYATVGIPIARHADHANRTRIVNWSLVLFSLMSAACGLAANYWQLIAARIGVALSEGGTNSPSHSMIRIFTPSTGAAPPWRSFRSGRISASCSVFSSAAGSDNSGDCAQRSWSRGSWDSSSPFLLSFIFEKPIAKKNRPKLSPLPFRFAACFGR